MTKKHDKSTDRNFDDLTHRFNRNIYDTLKGQIRLAVLQRDLEPYLSKPLKIIDAGGGQGVLSLSLAHKHKVTICDISIEMLKLAEKNAQHLECNTVNFLNCSIQQLPEKLDSLADMVLCHVVLEWMADPEEALKYLYQCIKPDGVLSLSFFNLNSIIYKNLLRGNFNKARSDDFTGYKGSLTPINPLKIKDVSTWLEKHNFEIISQSGIRVFNDYLTDKELQSKRSQAIIDTELEFSQKEPFRSLARYIHIIAKRR